MISTPSWREHDQYEVVAFTAAQIPDIAGRTYPPQLCGPKYPKGIPICPEEELAELIQKHNVEQVTIAYSDLPYDVVMHKAALVNAAGADFRIMGHRNTMLKSSKPVVAVCAVRTGCGKSQTSRKICEILKSMNKKVAVVRHPMPYGDWRSRSASGSGPWRTWTCTSAPSKSVRSTSPHIQAGKRRVRRGGLRRDPASAEAEADVVLWDGGNNDMSFYKPDLYIVVADPHRPGHEVRYYPGETNLRMADVIIINKVATANPENVRIVEENSRRLNPQAKIVMAHSPVSVADPEKIKGKKVLVVEDGPTLTHGEMTYGAGHVAATKFGAGEVVDPRPFAVGLDQGHL